MEQRLLEQKEHTQKSLADLYDNMKKFKEMMISSRQNYEQEVNFHLEQIRSLVQSNFSTKAETSAGIKKLQHTIQGIMKSDMPSIRSKSNSRAAAMLSKTGANNANMISGMDPGDVGGIYVLKQGFNSTMQSGTKQQQLPGSFTGLNQSNLAHVNLNNSNLSGGTRGSQGTDEGGVLMDDPFVQQKSATMNFRSGILNNTANSIEMSTSPYGMPAGKGNQNYLVSSC